LGEKNDIIKTYGSFVLSNFIVSFFVTKRIKKLIVSFLEVKLFFHVFVKYSA